MAEHTGKVAWFNAAKGYGFLASEGRPDVFCPFSAIRVEGYRQLKEGDGVAFDIIQRDKGPQAANVMRIDLT